MWQLKNRFLPVLGCLLVCCSYALVTELQLVNTAIVVPVQLISESLSEWLASGDLLRDAYDSCFRVFAGYFIGSVAGFLLGIVLTSNALWSQVLGGPLEALRVVSPLAWVPFAILFFGIGAAPAIFLVSIAAFFPCLLATFSALTHVDPKYVELSLIYEMSRPAAFMKVLLPAASPGIFAGLRTGFGISWYVVIAAEMLGAQSGLGYEIQANKLTLEMERVIASIVVIMVIGLLFSALFHLIESYATRWRV